MCASPCKACCASVGRTGLQMLEHGREQDEVIVGQLFGHLRMVEKPSRLTKRPNVESSPS
jgi:hypothetical protein